jgi:hypothetical protein
MPLVVFIFHALVLETHFRIDHAYKVNSLKHIYMCSEKDHLPAELTESDFTRSFFHRAFSDVCHLVIPLNVYQIFGFPCGGALEKAKCLRY